MTLSRRIVVCLDVANGKVVKGTGFVGLKEVGNPVDMAEKYERDGADEIVFLDIAASATDSESVLDIAQLASERVFIPLTIGGGMRNVGDVRRALRSGADKVSINTAAVLRPEILTECAERFGSQCVVVSIDAKLNAGGMYEVFTRGGRTPTGMDAVEWAERCVEAGAGEILLTSIDRDGSRAGYDMELTRRITDAVTVPVVASGGAGCAADVTAVLNEANADAALVAGILHDGTSTVAAIKRHAAAAGITVREVADQ